MTQKKIYMLGVGHNTPVFIDLALACGYEIIGLYHYNSERTNEIDHGFKILGSFEDLFSLKELDNMNFILTMGDNEVRTNISNMIRSMRGKIPSLIHPMACISNYATISPIGVYISPFTYVQADSSVGSNTILLSHVNISHTTQIGNSCFIAGGSTVGAYTKVDDLVFIGQGALSISNKVSKIGYKAYIGARSLITHDIPDYAIVAGSPAKIIGYVDNKVIKN